MARCARFRPVTGGSWTLTFVSALETFDAWGLASEIGRKPAVEGASVQ